MSEPTQDTRSTSSDWFLEACRDGSLSRTDAISYASDQDASTQSLGLKEAVEHGHFNVVRYLLELEHTIDIDKMTANHAAYSGLPIYRILHSRHPEILHWSFDTSGNAVFVAVRNGDNELLKYLLENGADPGRTPEGDREFYIYMTLDVAALRENVEGAKLLVKFGATFQFTEALRIVASRGSLETVRCFIGLGADINYIRGLQDPDWDTCSCECIGPLHSAAKEGHLEVVKLLLAHGADPQLGDTSGRTAVDAARGAGEEKVIDLLMKARI